MTNEGYQLYLERLKSIRETLTDPKRIKFIDDIFEAIQYKDNVINQVHSERSKLLESNMQLRTERDRYKAEKKLILTVTEKIMLST